MGLHLSERCTRLADALSVYVCRRVLIVMFLGFSAGLPLELSGSTLQARLHDAGFDPSAISRFVPLAMPYSIKFLWAPFIDALDVPWLSRLLGRRRAWLLLSQFLLMAAIILLAFTNPRTTLWLFAFSTLLVATASATQDIVIDAFRIESLPQSEQAAGAASYVTAYRIGMLASTPGPLFLVSKFEKLGLANHEAWTVGYIAIASFVLVGIITTLVATEHEKSVLAAAPEGQDNALQRIIRAVTGAVGDFLRLDQVWIILTFVLLFRFPYAFAEVNCLSSSIGIPEMNMQ
jgi:MFS transporter, PAT family, beta-lactamase induction signal transducer AmpG